MQLAVWFFSDCEITGHVFGCVRFVSVSTASLTHGQTVTAGWLTTDRDRLTRLAIGRRGRCETPTITIRRCSRSRASVCSSALGVTWPDVTSDSGRPSARKRDRNNSVNSPVRGISRFRFQERGCGVAYCILQAETCRRARLIVCNIYGMTRKVEGLLVRTTYRGIIVWFCEIVQKWFYFCAFMLDCIETWDEGKAAELIKLL